MKYEVIHKATGQPAQALYPSCPVIVTPEGLVAWWDDSQGWSIDPKQDDYTVQVTG